MCDARCGWRRQGWLPTLALLALLLASASLTVKGRREAALKDADAAPAEDAALAEDAAWFEAAPADDATGATTAAEEFPSDDSPWAEAKAAPAAEGSGEYRAPADYAVASAGEAWEVEEPGKNVADVTATDKCAAEAKAFCADVVPGEMRLLDCLSNQVNQKLGKAAADATPVSEQCKSEMRAFRIQLYEDISMDKKMTSACKEDIALYCKDDFLYPEPGNVLACLREMKQVGNLSEGCKEQVLRAQIDAANDFKLDPQLNEICSGEADRLCKGVEPGEGRIQDCLRSKRNMLSWDCQAELFRQEVENSDDIRLNVRLFKACLEDKKKYCPDVTPGDARVKDCLEQHREDSDFSPTCKVQFENMMERRTHDFRLDSNVRKFCKNDIVEICYPDAMNATDVANLGSKVIECLQDYRDELKDPHCRQQVHQVTKRAAENIRFDPILAKACAADRNTFCKDVEEGHARVFTCLQDNRTRLNDSCRRALFVREVRYAHDIDFKFPIRQACTEEVDRFCKDIVAGQGDVIKCLQEHTEDADMGKTCKDEVKKDEKRAAEDYWLNCKLSKECFNDVQALCPRACDKLLESGSTTCGGEVLKCLSENLVNLRSKACKEEVFYFMRREVADIELNVPLQHACKEDIGKLCADVSKDHSGMRACLRSKRDDLSSECKEEELRFSIMELQLALGQRTSVPAASTANMSCRLVLEGWVACVAVIALTAVLLGVAYLLYKEFFDPTVNYSRVVKAGDVKPQEVVIYSPHTQSSDTVFIWSQSIPPSFTVHNLSLK